MTRQNPLILYRMQIHAYENVVPAQLHPSTTSASVSMIERRHQEAVGEQEPRAEECNMQEDLFTARPMARHHDLLAMKHQSAQIRHHHRPQWFGMMSLRCKIGPSRLCKGRSTHLTCSLPILTRMGSAGVPDAAFSATHSQLSGQEKG